MDLYPKQHSQRISRSERDEASNLTLAVVMAGVGAFFIAGIASVFLYAKDSSPTQSTFAQKPAISTPAETTGYGGAK